MRRVTYKKFFAAFCAVTLVSSELGAAQLAPAISSTFVRPPSLQPRNPVPYLPPKRAKFERKYRQTQKKSLLRDMGESVSKKLAAGSVYMSRPKENLRIYKKAYIPRISSFFKRPARNFAFYKEAIRNGLSRLPSVRLPRFENMKKFLGVCWEGIAATAGAFPDLGGVLGKIGEVAGLVEPKSFSLMPAPIPAAHTRAVSRLLSLNDPAPKLSSINLVVPNRVNRRIQRRAWRGQREHWNTLVVLLSYWQGGSIKDNAWTGIWTQKDDREKDWQRAPGRAGTERPRFASFYLREPGSKGYEGDHGAESMLSFVRLKDDPFGSKSKGRMFASYTVFGVGPVPLKHAAPAANGRVVLTMLDNSKKEMEVLNVKELSPLVFDLNGDGVRTGSKKVRFDLDGDGRKDLLYDISPEDAVLVFDADGDGLFGENGKELFGDQTDLSAYGGEKGYRDGFASLGVLVERAVHEGVVTQDTLENGRLEAADLAALGERYGLKAKVGSLNAKPVSLAEAGIVSITLSREETMHVKDFDNRGNGLTSQKGAQFIRADGSAGNYGDIWFHFVPGAFDPDRALTRGSAASTRRWGAADRSAS